MKLEYIGIVAVGALGLAVSLSAIVAEVSHVVIGSDSDPIGRVSQSPTVPRTDDPGADESVSEDANGRSELISIRDRLRQWKELAEEALADARQGASDTLSEIVRWGLGYVPDPVRQLGSDFAQWVVEGVPRGIADARDAALALFRRHPLAGFIVGIPIGMGLQASDYIFGLAHGLLAIDDAGRAVMRMGAEGRLLELPGILVYGTWSGITGGIAAFVNGTQEFVTAVRNPNGFENGVIVGRGAANTITTVYLGRKPAGIAVDLAEEGFGRAMKFARSPTARRAYHRMARKPGAPPARLSKHVSDERIMELSGLSWEQLLRMRTEHPQLATDLILRAEMLQVSHYAGAPQRVPPGLLAHVVTARRELSGANDTARLRMLLYREQTTRDELASYVENFRAIEEATKIANQGRR